MVTRRVTDKNELAPLKLVVHTDENDVVDDVLVNYTPKAFHTASIGVYIMRKDFLQILENANARGEYDFSRDVIQKKHKQLKIVGYEFDRTVLYIDSVIAYFNANMALLDPNVRKDIFLKDKSIFTKTRDEVPALYDECGCVKNSLIADGCVINGTVENSILFRGVKVKKGAVIKKFYHYAYFCWREC